MQDIEITMAGSGINDASIIRNALDIESTLIIKDQLIKEGRSIAEHGLLISVYTEGYVRKMLSEGGSVYLASCRGDPAGYIFIAPGSYFEKELSSASVIWPNKEAERAFGSLLSSETSLLIKQIGILRKFHGKGVAQALVDRMEKDMRGHPLTAYIATKPIDNVRSRAFFKRNGYQFIADAVFDDYRGINDFRVAIIFKQC